MKRRWGAFGAAVAAAAIVSSACSPGAPEADEAQKAAGSSDAPAAVSPAASGAGEVADMRWATAEFEVEGMYCGGCTLATEAALRKVEGIRSAEASLEGEKGGTARVTYDAARTSTQQLAAAIEEVGFRPHLRETSAP